MSEGDYQGFTVATATGDCAGEHEDDETSEEEWLWSSWVVPIGDEVKRHFFADGSKVAFGDRGRFKFLPR